MYQVLLTIGSLLLLYAYLSCVYKPKKQFNRYVKQFEKQGYKVYSIFQPFGVPFKKFIDKGKYEGDSMKYIKEIYKQNDVVIANAFNRIFIDLSNPDLIKDFYAVDRHYVYPKSKFLVAAITRAMGQGIPFSQGQIWKRKRRIINRVFNFDFIKSMSEKIQLLCEEGLSKIEKQSTKVIAKNSEQVYQYEILDAMVEMFSSVILECFLGGAAHEKLDGKNLSQFTNQMMTDVTRQGSQIISILFGVKVLNVGFRAKDRDINRRIALFKEWGHKFVHKRIQESKIKIAKSGSDHPPVDIIEALVRQGIQGRESYTQSQIIQQFCTFLVAGTDTTSHLTLMMIYYVAQHPKVQKRLREEIDKYMKGNDFSFQNLKNLIYIDYIQKQTGRMYGPITGLFLREVQQDNQLGGIAIKKNTYVTIQHLGNHYSEKYFSQPYQFRPQRWQSQCDSLKPFATGGFSAGARTCIGKHLAYLESKIALIVFMKRYQKIQLPKKSIKMQLNFVYAPQSFKSKMTISK